jgi:hypothetical protein
MCSSISHNWNGDFRVVIWSHCETHSKARDGWTRSQPQELEDD